MSSLRMTLLALVTVVLGCSSSSRDGITLRVTHEAPVSPPLVNEVRTFDTDLGYRVVLTRAWLATGTVEVFACGTRTSWRDLFLREAHAHTTGSPTLLGVPAVESLLAPAETSVVAGDLHPPAGSYCRAKQTIHAADDDAVGLAEVPSMLGRSFLLEGTYARSEMAPIPFQVASALSVEVETTFPEAELTIDGLRSATLMLSKTGDRWFDGIDFAFATPDDIAPRFLQNLRRSLGARVP